MAFVYKSEKKVTNDNFENIGPGKYLTHTEYKFHENNVAFLSRAEKFSALKKEKQKKQSEIDLALTSNFANSQLHNQLLTESLHTKNKSKFQKKAPNSVFKSESKRFQPQQKIEDFPGPGTYHNPEIIEKKESKKKEVILEKTSVIDEIMHRGNYQPIPSIPSNIHALGYSDLECSPFPELKVNKSIKKEINKGEVGPGSYELKDAFELRRNKGYSWGKKGNSHQNVRKIKESANLGPGSYDVRFDSQPLYKYKQSGPFCSTMSRSFLEQKPSGERVKKLIYQRMKKNQQNFGSSSSENNILDSNLSNELYDFKESGSIGPGSYYNEKLASSIKIQSKPPELQNFGSSSLRFDQKQVGFKTLGPGKYDTKIIEASKMAPIVYVPFLSSNERFENKTTLGMPGPGSYDPKLKISAKNDQVKALNKINFGVNEQRFKNNDEKENKPGPGTYIEPLQPKKGSSASNFYFKSQAERDTFRSNTITPGAGTYNVNNHMIEMNVRNIKEQDPDILKKKPPFNIQQERFSSPKKNDHDDFDLDVEEKNPKIHSKALGAKYLKKPKKGKTIQTDNSNYLKFKSTNQKSPGPGHYYDPNNDLWNKKTYNIMFAEL